MPLKNLRERQQSAAPPSDPENREWTSHAATNVAALTSKQRYDLKRVRGRYDLHAEEIDQALAQIADRFNTSKSQVASFLLAYALVDYLDDDRLWNLIADAKTPARTLQYEWTLDIPDDWIDSLRAFLRDGPD